MPARSRRSQLLMMTDLVTFCLSHLLQPIAFTPAKRGRPLALFARSFNLLRRR